MSLMTVIILLAFSSFFNLIFINSGSCPSKPIETFSKIEITNINDRLINWAIVCLVPAGSHEEQATKRNELLVRYLKHFPSNNRRNISVLMFSEWNLQHNIQYKTWEHMFDGLATFKFINTEHLGFQDNDPRQSKRVYGYKYMCKFFMLDLANYLSLGNYDYYWRVDTDCFLLRLGYDVFNWFETNDLEYGYIIIGGTDHIPTRQTLIPFVEEYVKNCSILPQSFTSTSISESMHFYNNFHIAKVSFFMRKDVQHFLLSVNSSGNIVKYRWGDSEVQAYAVRLFMNQSKVQFINEYEYVHGSHRSYLENGQMHAERGILYRMLSLNVSKMPWPFPT